VIQIHLYLIPDLEKNKFLSWKKIYYEREKKSIVKEHETNIVFFLKKKKKPFFWTDSLSLFSINVMITHAICLPLAMSFSNRCVSFDVYGDSPTGSQCWRI
jgi:hypothetical protein